MGGSFEKREGLLGSDQLVLLATYLNLVGK